MWTNCESRDTVKLKAIYINDIVTLYILLWCCAMGHWKVFLPSMFKLVMLILFAYDINLFCHSTRHNVNALVKDIIRELVHVYAWVQSKKISLNIDEANTCPSHQNVHLWKVVYSLYIHNMGLFVYKDDNDMLSEMFVDLFIPVRNIHDYNTRTAAEHKMNTFHGTTRSQKCIRYTLGLMHRISCMVLRMAYRHFCKSIFDVSWRYATICLRDDVMQPQS